MRKMMVVFGIMAIAMAASGPAMASHICAYVNDNVNGSSGPNAVAHFRWRKENLTLRQHTSWPDNSEMRF